jgi:hypothetical protein
VDLGGSLPLPRSPQPSRRRHDVTNSFLFFLYPTAFTNRCQSIGAILIFIGTFHT